MISAEDKKVLFRILPSLEVLTGVLEHEGDRWDSFKPDHSGLMEFIPSKSSGPTVCRTSAAFLNKTLYKIYDDL